jgi:O-antigen ligase
VRYTVTGPYRWLGKGYGINLANADGYQVRVDESLRSPHNVNFTILARGGVLGLTTWLGLLATLAWILARRARTAPRERDRRIALWVLAYGLASFINGSFDVYLEGPQGGIWFWCIVGVALLLVEPADDIPRAVPYAHEAAARERP